MKTSNSPGGRSVADAWSVHALIAAADPELSTAISCAP